jgi:hypothetical protein
MSPLMELLMLVAPPWRSKAAELIIEIVELERRVAGSSLHERNVVQDCRDRAMVVGAHERESRTP